MSSLNSCWDHLAGEAAHFAEIDGEGSEAAEDELVEGEIVITDKPYVFPGNEAGGRYGFQKPLITFATMSPYRLALRPKRGSMQNRQMRLAKSFLDDFPIATFILADTNNQASFFQH